MRNDAARRVRTRVMGGSVAAAALVLVAVLWPTADGEPDAYVGTGEIACADCLRLMPDYHRQLVDDAPMPTSDFEAVAAHLAACPTCRDHFEQAYPGALAAAAAAGVGLFGLATRRRRRG